MNFAGARLPQDMIPAGPDNPDGFWESRTVVAIDDALLALFDATWCDPFFLPHPLPDVPSLADLQSAARVFLRRQLEGAGAVVLKDPRMSRLMPFWLAAARDVGAQPVALLTLRDPSAVAASLRLRNSLSRARSYGLWLEHVLAAERDTRRLPRYLLSFDALIREPVAVVERVAAALDLDFPQGANWQPRARAYVDSRKVVHRPRSSVLDRSSAERRAAYRVYERLQACRDGIVPSEASDFLDHIARRRRSGSLAPANVMEEGDFAPAMSPTQ